MNSNLTTNPALRGAFFILLKNFIFFFTKSLNNWKSRRRFVSTKNGTILLNFKNDKIMTLRFGKFKGQKFENTPKWYQEWLLKQDWFKAPKQEKQEKPLHQQLNGWDGYSRKGEAVYNSIFEQEKEQGDMLDRMSGMYEEGGMYYGI